MLIKKNFSMQIKGHFSVYSPKVKTVFVYLITGGNRIILCKVGKTADFPKPQGRSLQFKLKGLSH